MAEAHVGVRSGEGLVARFAGTVVVVPTDPAASATDLLRGLESASREYPTGGWVRGLGRSLAAGEPPDFGMASLDSDGVVIVLRGPVRARVITPAGTVDLTGEQSLTWHERRVTGPVTSVAISLGTLEIEPHPQFDLQAGRVPGDGFLLRFEGAPAATPSVAAAPPRLTPARLTPAPPPPARIRPKAPPISGLPGTAPGGPSEPRLSPVETMFQPNLMSVLVADDDGMRIMLDRNYVLGRDPYQDPAAQSGEASPIMIRDPDGLISRVQAYVDVLPNGVVVRDAYSANGTFLAPAGGEEWVKLNDQPAPLPIGWCLRIGKRMFTHLGPS